MHGRMILKRTAVIFAVAVMLASQTCPADEIVMEDGAYEIREDISGDTGYTPEETQDDFAGLIEDDETDSVTETEDAFRPEVPGNAQACPDDGHDWGEWIDVTGDREFGTFYERTCRRCGKKDEKALGSAIVSKEIPPTCTEPGREIVYTRNNSGEDVIISDTVTAEPLGHDFSLAVQTTAPADCEAGGGTILYKCSRCPATKTETLPPSEHDWTEWEQFGEGRNLDARSRCTVCGKERTASQIAASFAYTPASCLVQEMKVFFDEDGREIVALAGEESSGHVPGEYVQEAPGEPYVQRCVNCGEVLGSKSYATSVRIPPTCTEPGYIVEETAGVTRREEYTPALGHDFSVVKQTAAPEDCTVSGGAVTYGCSRCGETKTVTLPPSEHDWTEWTGTATKTRECRKCHKQETTEDSSSGSRDPAPSNTDGQGTASSGTGANPSAGSVKPASVAASKPAAPAKKQPVTITAKGLKDGKLALKKGKSRKLKAVLSGVKGKVKWSSSKKKVVSVDKKGKIKAKKKGTAYITAKVGKHKVKIKVVVR